jgi:hypothetical protein
MSVELHRVASPPQSMARCDRARHQNGNGIQTARPTSVTAAFWFRYFYFLSLLVTPPQPPTYDLPVLNYFTPTSRNHPALECAERYSVQHLHIMSSGSPSGSGRATPSNSSPSPMRRHPGRPQYMTVGNGSTSEHASRLAAMLDNDSGYGGSIADGATFDPTFDQDPMNHLATAQGANCEHQLYFYTHVCKYSDTLDSRQ